jgi:outer membrane lipoprotein carrier protein
MLMRSGLIIALMSLAALARADEAALQKLSAHLDPLKSMQAHFTQTVSDEQGKVMQTSQGTLAVKRNNHLRWETSAPFSYLIVTDGKVLWRFDKDLEQATRQTFKGELADTPALIFSGDTAKLRDAYTVSWQQGGDGDRFLLVPKRKNALFRSLSLNFSGAGVSQLILRDNLEQNTDIHFDTEQLNPALPDSLFQFSAPAGVDVVVDES